MRLVAMASAASVVIGSSQLNGVCLHVVPQAQNVGEKDRVEQAGLGLLRHLHRVADIGERQLRRLRMPPRGLVMPAALDEQVEVHLACHDRMLDR